MFLTLPDTAWDIIIALTFGTRELVYSKSPSQAVVLARELAVLSLSNKHLRGKLKNLEAVCWLHGWGSEWFFSTGFFFCHDHSRASSWWQQLMDFEEGEAQGYLELSGGSSLWQSVQLVNFTWRWSSLCLSLPVAHTHVKQVLVNYLVKS